MFVKKGELHKKIGFRQRPLVVFDLETTGLNPNKHEIIEIGCFVVDPRILRVKKKYEAKVKPEHIESADPAALEINGFSPKKWRKAKSLKQALKEFNSLAPKGMLAGWNVSFDRGFIERAFWQEKMILNFDYHWIDLMSIAYEKLFFEKKPERIGLTYVCEILGIPHKKAHTAMGDVEATLAVYKALRDLK